MSQPIASNVSLTALAIPPLPQTPRYFPAKGGNVPLDCAAYDRDVEKWRQDFQRVLQRAAQAPLGSASQTAVNLLKEQLAALSTRLEALEKRPVAAAASVMSRANASELTGGGETGLHTHASFVGPLETLYLEADDTTVHAVELLLVGGSYALAVDQDTATPGDYQDKVLLGTEDHTQHALRLIEDSGNYALSFDQDTFAIMATSLGVWLIANDLTVHDLLATDEGGVYGFEVDQSTPE